MPSSPKASVSIIVGFPNASLTLPAIIPAMDSWQFSRYITKISSSTYSLSASSTATFTFMAVRSFLSSLSSFKCMAYSFASSLLSDINIFKATSAFSSLPPAFRQGPITNPIL